MDSPINPEKTIAYIEIVGEYCWVDFDKAMQLAADSLSWHFSQPINEYQSYKNGLTSTHELWDSIPDYGYTAMRRSHLLDIIAEVVDEFGLTEVREALDDIAEAIA